MAVYTYSTGDLLTNPNSYFFSDTGGSAFLDAYLESRLESLNYFSGFGLFTIIPSPELASWPLTEWNDWINNPALHEAPDSVEMFLKRFAVSKKVWSKYTNEMRPTDDAVSRDLRLYLKVGKLAVDSVSKCRDLRFLNVALQCVDILIAHKNELPLEFGGEAVELVARELACVLQLWRGQLS